MKTYEETFHAVLTKRDALLTEKNRRNKTVRRIAVPLACGAVLLAVAAGILRGGVLNKKPTVPPEENAPQGTAPAVLREESAAQTTAPALSWEAPDTQTASRDVPAGETGVSRGYAVSVPEVPADGVPTTAAAAPPEPAAAEDGGNFGGTNKSGGNVGYFNIPVLPQDRTLVTTGERITDEEAAAYFAERKSSLAQSLAASGVPASDLRFSEKGYCHVCYSGLEGERLEVRENFRDYLVYNGGSLIAIVTLYKEDGKLFDTPAFGAAWFSDYNAFLQKHRGEALVYVYAGSAEIVLTPDGGMYSALAGIVPEYYMEGIADPYRVFYHPSDVYVP